MADKRIKDLNTFTGYPGMSDWLAVDSANETKKIAADGIGPRKVITSEVTINTDVIENPETIAVCRVGKVVQVTAWGTKFKAGIPNMGVIISEGMPNRQGNCSGYLAIGGSRAYDIQGNMYISSVGELRYGLKPDFAAGEPLFGSFTYITSQ